MAFEKLAREQQNRIINAACEVFAKRGYRKASTKDIAEAAGISKSVLFKYFSSKENLYLQLIRLASDSISEADNLARAEQAEDDSRFSLMRRSARIRLSLFKQYPWIYRFSYTAAFDTDPFVKELVSKELEHYRSQRQAAGEHQWAADGTSHGLGDYVGLRQDFPLETARQIILWVSQGYLEEQLNKGSIEPDELEQGFERWIDVLELLLKGGSGDSDQTSGKVGAESE